MIEIKSLYDILNAKIIQFGVQHKHLSIDESMIPYFGRHLCKQFIRGKPVRFGYNQWCICSSSGVPYNAVIYEGKTGNCKGPLGTGIVLDLVSIYENPKRHHIYIDNFFSSYVLFMKLKELHFRATGAIKENRLNGCTIMSKKTMKKKKRDTFDYRSQGSLEVVRWNDNAEVFFFYLYIYPPDSQESDGGAIHRVSNYPDLLPEMPRYCCPLVI